MKKNDIKYSARWSLKNRVTLVTGATKGIGRAIAEEFASLGAKLAITSRNQSDIDDFVKELKANKVDVIGIKADASKQADRERTITSTIEHFGKLDFLINNAGTNVRKWTMEFTNDEFEFLINTNMKAAFEMCRLSYEHLKKSDYPSIVNISSIAGSNIVKTGAPYAMAKAALSHMSRYLAVEWGPDNIRVNAIEPWYIRTPLTNVVLGNQEALSKITAKTPLGRYGEADEISGLAAFLCMPASSYISGHCIPIDGAASVYMY